LRVCISLKVEVDLARVLIHMLLRVKASIDRLPVLLFRKLDLRLWNHWGLVDAPGLHMLVELGLCAEVAYAAVTPVVARGVCYYPVLEDAFGSAKFAETCDIDVVPLPEEQADLMLEWALFCVGASEALLEIRLSDPARDSFVQLKDEDSNLRPVLVLEFLNLFGIQLGPLQPCEVQAASLERACALEGYAVLALKVVSRFVWIV
jgi:hypothetical protein